MDALLCNEVWITSPDRALHDVDAIQDNVPRGDGIFSFDDCMIKDEAEQALRVLLEREVSFMPHADYANYVRSSSDELIRNSRVKSLHWMIKAQRRLNLSLATILTAANCFDRFISVNLQNHDWKNYIFELLSIACLSVASKFADTEALTLHDFQMDIGEHLFEASLIQRMELSLLKTLGWRLSSTTPFSFLELLPPDLVCSDKCLSHELDARVTTRLLNALLDPKFLEFRPSVIAESVLRCTWEELLPSTSNDCLNFFTPLFPDDLKDDVIKCHKIMQNQMTDCPSSPLTVFDFNDSLLRAPELSIADPKMATSKKRKREEFEWSAWV